MKRNNILAQLLPHVCIILSVALMTIFIVDMVNQSLHLTDNSMTKWMLCILCLSSFAVSLLLCGYQRRDR